MTIIIIALICGSFIGLLISLSLIMGRARKHSIAEVNQRFENEHVILMALNASFFGEQSRGIRQIRGNGALVFTEKELYFLRACPRKEIIIPLDQLVSVSLRKSHLGKSIFQSLLWVEYHTETPVDSVAWAINNPDEWKQPIEAAQRV